MIEVKNVYFEYDNFRALHDVSLTLPDSSIYGLVGPNGAGKTTLMRCMATYQHPFSGTVHIDGLSTLNQTRACHEKIKFLPDFSCFYESLTVIDFLSYMASAHLAKSHAARSVDAAIDLLGLKEYKNQPLNALSRGWRQRTGIASMVVTGAKYLLLDEPASGLDPEARIHLSDVFQELKSRGHGLLVSSHILEELDQYCDEVIVMKAGEIRSTIDLGNQVNEGPTLLEVETTSPIKLESFLHENREEYGVKRLKRGSRNIREVYLEEIEKND